MRQSIVVLDDFYDDPDAIRKLALSLRFLRRPGATYPGGAAVADRDFSVERARLRAKIDEAVDASCPKATAFPQGMFRLAVAADEHTRIDGVHQDRQRWSGVVYLSHNQDCTGGVAFYRHRLTGATSATAEWEMETFAGLTGKSVEEVRSAALAYLKDPSHWEEIGRVAMRYNRAVLVMAHCFHASVGVFGGAPERGRLTQHFEFYAEGDI
jgi:hypothetical protein